MAMQSASLQDGLKLEHAKFEILNYLNQEHGHHVCEEGIAERLANTTVLRVGFDTAIRSLGKELSYMQDMSLYFGITVEGRRSLLRAVAEMAPLEEIAYTPSSPSIAILQRLSEKEDHTYLGLTTPDDLRSLRSLVRSGFVLVWPNDTDHMVPTPSGQEEHSISFEGRLQLRKARNGWISQKPASPQAVQIGTK